MTDLPKAARKYMAEISPTELACRMLEAMQGMKRPPGKSAAESILALDPESQIWIRRGAEAALEYVAECFSASNRVM